MRSGEPKAERQTTKFVSPGEAAEVLGAHPQTLRRWARAGMLPHYVTSGGRYRYDLCAFLASLPKNQRRAA
jgi:excisionase family DNA binding protein